ncbi:MAG: glycogen synthase GlgA [Mariprofundaceae bacterium]
MPARIVFIASEAAPLAKTGGLADVAGALPRSLQALGHLATVILPWHKRHVPADLPIRPLGCTIETWADGRQWFCPVHEPTERGLRYILVEQDDLFGREGLYGPPGGAWDDNLLRFLVFSRVAIEAVERVLGGADIIHCHDWQTALIPLLLRTQYGHLPAVREARTVYTIHNLAYQGIFDAGWIHRLGLPSHHFHPEDYEFHGQINCMKAGIANADAITTVSPSYAREILTPLYGCGLDGFLRRHAGKLRGIVNGIDTEVWNPATDDALAARFSAARRAGRKRCKAALQSLCGFEADPDTPLLALISRLAEQKGIDLLLANAEAWLARGRQIAVLGSGDPEAERALTALAERFPRTFFFHCGFDETLARRIYAGADIFLMPSRFEPCGLGQLMAMRYGTVPVVRATGGLIDTVTDYHADKTHATGLHFHEAEPAAFDAAVNAAVALFHRPRAFARIRGNAMRRDSSWGASAAEYATLYRRLRAAP